MTVIAAILRSKGSEVVTARIEQTIGEVVAILHERNIGAVPVLDGERIAGVLSERDIVKCLHERSATVLESRAAELMSSQVLTVAPGDTVTVALTLMTNHRVRHLPVCDGGALVGLVSIGDLVKSRIEEAEAEAETLREYITAA